MIQLIEPYTEESVRALKMGDMVHVTGVVYTGRDAVHKYLFEGGKPPVALENQMIYHCGPVVAGLDTRQYRFVAAGPTTSIREEPYQAHVIRTYGVRAVIGKGVNIGAGTITCNYDGYKKSPTTIGEGAFIGSDTMLVAPVNVGKNAKTGAGAVVTHDVADDELVYGVPAKVKRQE